jgi:hypothetical protein
MIVKNQVITNRSVHRKSFEQHPTTFHDVKLIGGKPFKNPSLERMIEVFAKIMTKEAKQWHSQTKIKRNSQACRGKAERVGG